MPDIIYLDNQSTTRVDPRVVESMLPVFDLNYANSGSVTHELGLAASDLVEESAESIADCLNARRSEIVFTSGATESNNLAIRGICLRRKTSGHIVTVETEHKAVLDPIAKLEKQGFEVTRLPVIGNGKDDAGLICLDELAASIRQDTLLVSVMMANNEIGVIHPIRQIAEICHQRDTLLHVDATQAVGHLPVDVNELDVDLMSFSAHKFYGPKGVGGLYVRRTDRRVRLASQIDGGGQQENRRSGTLNVPGIVGMASALKLCHDEIVDGSENERRGELRDRLYDQLQQELGDLPLNGPNLKNSDLRLPNNLNCQFPNIVGSCDLQRQRVYVDRPRAQPCPCRIGTRPRRDSIEFADERRSIHYGGGNRPCGCIVGKIRRINASIWQPMNVECVIPA
jgi:cysteine desulfurase